MIDVTSLEENGYSVVENLIAPNRIAEFERQMKRMGESGLRRKALPVPEIDPLSHLLKTGGEYRVRLFANLKHLKLVQEMNHQVSVRLQREGFFDWAGIEIPLCYPTLRADPPDETKYLLPPHQDFATQCARAWRFWIPLRDVSAKAGTLRLYPGTHRLGMIAHDVSDPAHPVVPPAHYSNIDPIDIELDAGHGVLLDPLIVHASVPSTNGQMKYVLLVQIQDLTSLADADDPDDPLPARLAMGKERDRARN